MKLIQQSKLYFKEGNSDKVYEIDLCELSPTEYIVNFRYGRRGSALKEGTKTPEAVSREKAELLFSGLENEKRKKGYQTETEVFIELPSLEAVNPKSASGAILQRLQDAVEGKNSFKTEWKPSRVIWKAGELQLNEAIPFIIKLASKSDEMQIYSSLYALTRLKADQAEPLFRAFALKPKQKAYLSHMACEGLLTVLEGDELKAFARELFEKIPIEIRNNIELRDYDALLTDLKAHAGSKRVEYFTFLYLYSKVRPDLLPVLNEAMKSWAFKPPYFNRIRSVYKLAQIRNDYATLSVLSYRFEKENAMFRRTWALDSDYRQYITSIEKSVRVGAELKSKDSEIAFSNFTKTYFRKNSIEYLKKKGIGDAKEYLKLAVSLLLQYSEKDYSPAGERPFSDYGEYDYRKKIYYFRLINYPECYDSLLLSTILFGNDPKRKLQPNLNYVYGSRRVSSQSYYYQPDKVNNVEEQAVRPVLFEINRKSSVIDRLKSFFGGEKTEPVCEEMKQSEQSEKAEAEIPVDDMRKELFPEHWDAMPEAYIQLLIQARMNVIHRFAYENLKMRNDFSEIVHRFDEKVLLHLLNSTFEQPRALGLETIKMREAEFSGNPKFVGEVLNSNAPEAYSWAQTLIAANPEIYVNDLDFAVLLIYNDKVQNKQWIDDLLQKMNFSEERQQVLLGKTVAELLRLDNTEENNKLAEMAVGRLNLIASSQLNKIDWNIVEQLIVSPLLTNIWLASNIVIKKSEKTNPQDIPLSLVELFLNSDIAEVRQNGIKLLNSYPKNFLAENYDFVSNRIENAHQDVVETILECVRGLVYVNPSSGNPIVKHFVYAMMRKEKFDGAHVLISSFILNDFKIYLNSGLTPKDITKLIHSQYRQGQLTGYEILTNYDRLNDFTMRQIVSFGNHELLALRRWCRDYFERNVSRVRFEKDAALGLLDSDKNDTRAFAFQFFKKEFTENDWDTDVLITIADSIRPDVESFGKELITHYFKPENAEEYLFKLSEHPSVNVQAFVTTYLAGYASDNIEMIKNLEFYFRSVLTRVNKARVAKDRIYAFLCKEAVKSEEAAGIVVPILDDVSAQSSVQDKATCIRILTEIKTVYPHLDMHLTIKN